MLKLLENPSVYTLNKFITHPALYKLHTGDELYRAENIKYDPMTNFIIYIEKETGKYVGAISYNIKGHTLAEIHIWILPEWWGTPYTNDVASMTKEFLREKKKLKKLFTYIPHTAKHAIALVTRHGATVAGKLDACFTYNDELCDLLIFEEAL